MKNILLLNPGGPGTIMRGLIRERPTQFGFCWPPVDLVLVSGFLHEKGYHLNYIDASIDNLSTAEVDQRVKENNIEVIISLYSHFTKFNDISFLKEIKKTHPHLKIIILPDIEYAFFPDKALRFLEEQNWLDAIVLNIIYNDLDRYLKGNYSSNGLVNLFYKIDRRIIEGQIVDVSNDDYYIPIPRHELFKNKRYFLPQSRTLYVTTTNMHFGCQFKCAFCMDKLAYKKVWCRSPENMLDEFEYIASQGFKEVYFRDLTFGLDRERTLKFCKGLIRNYASLHWVCSSRVDILDEEILEYMKKTGCMCIEFGIESGLDRTKEIYKKGFKNEQITKTFAICRRLGIETAAFLILGFPEETIDDIKSSIKFSFNLKSDFIALNFANVLPETDFEKRKLVDKNTDKSMLSMLDPWNSYFFDSLNFSHPNISEANLKKLFKKTLMQFYLRPSFIFKRLLKIKSIEALVRTIFIGTNIIRASLDKSEKKSLLLLTQAKLKKTVKVDN